MSDEQYYTNPVSYLRKMEEVLRLADRKNRLSGLYIEIEDGTVSAWCEFLREVIAAQEVIPSASASPGPAGGANR